MTTQIYKGFKIYSARSGSNLRCRSIKAKKEGCDRVFEITYDGSQHMAIMAIKADIDEYLTKVSQ